MGAWRPPGLRVTWLSPQLGRSTGPRLLQLFLDLLQRLLAHCEQLDAESRRKCEAAQAGSDLFLDTEAVASLELADDKVRGSPACWPVPGTGIRRKCVSIAGT